LLHTKMPRLQGKEKKCLEKYFSDDRARRDINVEYAYFSMCLDDFRAIDAMNDRFHMEPM
ncbi:PREDICTED: LOC110757307, partial [Prunus dulcis]